TRLAYINQFYQLIDRAFPIAKGVDEAAPGRVGQDLEHVGHDDILLQRDISCQQYVLRRQPAEGAAAQAAARRPCRPAWPALLLVGRRPVRSPLARESVPRAPAARLTPFRPSRTGWSGGSPTDRGPPPRTLRRAWRSARRLCLGRHPRCSKHPHVARPVASWSVQQRRVAIGVGGDEASDAHSLGGLGHRRLQRPALVDRAVSGGAANRRQVVEVPQVVEAGLVGDAPDRAQRLDRDVLPRCLQPEAEWMRHQWKRSLRTRIGYLYFAAKSSTDMPRFRIWLRYL